MTMLLRYLLTDGQITGIWEGSPVSLLESQIPGDDLVAGYLVLEEDLSPAGLGDRYYVPLGLLEPKTAVVLTPDVLTFDADGVDECTISVVPFVACAVQVNGGAPVALTGGDPTVVLTADVPEAFTVTLVPMAAAWAEAVTVEAV